MWSLLETRHQVLIVIGAGILAAWAFDGAYWLVVGQHPGVFQLISLATFCVGTVMVAATEVSWRRIWRRFPIIQRKTFPDLNGNWEGTLVSTWIDPKTNTPIAPIPTTITIRQRFFFPTSVSSKTGESQSHSTRVFLEPFRDTGRFRIWYSYNNDPQAQYQHRSSPHEGVAFLEVDFDGDPNKLAGRYYTARRTTGDIEVRRNVQSA